VFDWELRDPLFLIVAALAPLVYWLAARMPAVLTYSSLALVDVAPRSQRARLAKLPALLLAAATLALAVALAGPRTFPYPPRGHCDRDGGGSLGLDAGERFRARECVHQSIGRG